ncbi:hypothetical protein V2J09_012946 [Rumex salicifolius]
MDTSQLYSAIGEPSSSGKRRRRSREIETLSLEIRKHPRDLFHSFLTTDPIATQNGRNLPENSAIEEQREDKEIELKLGLSLGGRFGVDKSHSGLVRASSIAGTVPTFREVESSSAVSEKVAALARTSSLPAETEDEWRRRKEMQSLRRMEARRRRSEKQKNTKDNPGIQSGSSDFNLKRQLSGQPEKMIPGSGFESTVRIKGKGGFIGSLQGLLAQQQQQQGNSQGSGESLGGCSSGFSGPHLGSNSCGETRSPASAHSTQERGIQDPKLVSPSNKQPETSDHKKKKKEGEPGGGIEDMPCVFTIGDGPNGRKVEGILYKYCKGEEIRIMCVCHGSFFSPAEFVKHAGGRDVDQPLKHIVVNPSPSTF